MVQGLLPFCTNLIVLSRSETSYFSLSHRPAGTPKRDDGHQGGRGGRGALRVPPRHACPGEGPTGAVHPRTPTPAPPPSLLSALPRRGPAAVLPRHRWSPAGGGRACRSFTSTASAPTAAAPSSATAGAADRLRWARLGPRFPGRAPQGRPAGRGPPRHQGTRPTLGRPPPAAGRGRWGAVAWRSPSGAVEVRVAEAGDLCVPGHGRPWGRAPAMAPFSGRKVCLCGGCPIRVFPLDQTVHAEGWRWHNWFL